MRLATIWRHWERLLVDRLVRWERHRRRRVRPPRPSLIPRSVACADVRVVDADRGIVTCDPQRTSVIILGGGVTARFAPFDDPTCEVWSCNDLASVARDAHGAFRADRWFELHPRDPVVEWRRTEDYWDWLATLPIPLYQFGRRDNPRSVEFPLATAIAAGKDYFACTFAYQLALAVAEGFTRIGLYGVTLGTAREATVERASVEWWTGWAQAKGIEVVGATTHPYRYAYGADCERERASVYTWIRDVYAPTIPAFLIGNRPPWTLAEWWRWRRSRAGAS